VTGHRARDDQALRAVRREVEAVDPAVVAVSVSLSALSVIPSLFSRRNGVTVIGALETIRPVKTTFLEPLCVTRTCQPFASCQM